MGKRNYADKTTCERCDGDRYVMVYSTEKCPNCKGKGWTEGFFGGVSTCSMCDGNKVIHGRRRRKECSDCSGRGYHVEMKWVCEYCNDEYCDGDETTCRVTRERYRR